MNDRYDLGEIARVSTGIRNLDALLGGGLPTNSISVVAGPPGGGKTILAQQIAFHNASLDRRVLYFNTLSEPVAKTLRYISQFRFFDKTKVDEAIRFVDLGDPLRNSGLAEVSALVMEQVKELTPALVVIDSFKVFDDLVQSNEALRKFTYDLTINLMAWETTTLLLGEYGPEELAQNPLSSVMDGMILVSQREQFGEERRFLRIPKMRGTKHSREEHSFLITRDGIDVFAPRFTIERTNRGGGAQRCVTGITKVDALLGAGIPRGSSVLIAGVAGTGKTVLLLEFIYRGALAGEKGIMFSFEETEERLRLSAEGLGWDLDHQIKQGMIEVVFIPQPSIRVEEDLLMMRERIVAMDAKRVCIDSVSVFLHKMKDGQSSREKLFQLATIIQNVGAVGFFATDVPYGTNQISRFGVEETVVDGVFLLSATEEGLDRQRYLEIYKLRGTDHLKGRHNMLIGPGGITVFPRYVGATPPDELPAADTAKRLSTGVPGMDALLGGGLLERSVTIVSGSTGIGKSTMGIQFIVEGLAHDEPALYVALEEGPAQIVKAAAELGLRLQEGIDAGLVEIIYLSREHIRAHQFLTILADRIQKQGTRRLVLDSASQIADDLRPDELRQLLTALTARFKGLGVTSMLTLEARSLFTADGVTERGFSPIADNILILRYVQTPGEMKATVLVVKTRRSEHDWGTHFFTIGKGGVQITSRSGALAGGDGKKDDDEE